jgi:peptide/nickel transport system substrate-binding protein
MHEPNVLDPTGYDQVDHVDDTDPRTAVVTFKAPYADWQDLFGLYYGVLPKHLLDGRDRNAAMKDGYRWSGGPWTIQSWTKGRSIVLVPNRRFWSKQPKLERVIFTFVTDESSEQQIYRKGQVDVIAPIGRFSRADERALPNSNFSITTGMNQEWLVFNTEMPPLDDRAVRQALAYATDRAAIAGAVFALAPQHAAIDSFMTPANPWYVNPFSRYRRDLQKVADIMGADGWSRGPDGVWVRKGQRATVQFTTMDQVPVGRAEIEGRLFQSQWRDAGFDVIAQATPRDLLFGDVGPNGKFSTMSYFILPTATFSPSDCADWCSDNIPPAGLTSNWSRLRNSTVDSLFHRINTELDANRRKALVTQVQQVLSDEVPGLPLAAQPSVMYWRSTVGGPIGPQDPFGPFVNLNEWYCKGGHCAIP